MTGRDEVKAAVAAAAKSVWENEPTSGRIFASWSRLTCKATQEALKFLNPPLLEKKQTETLAKALARKVIHTNLVSIRATGRKICFSISADLDDDICIGDPEWRRKLSPLFRATVSLALNIEGRVYPSVEHAIQAAKFAHFVLPRDEANKFAKSFESGGVIGRQDPKKARAAGTEEALARKGLILDVKDWKGHRDGFVDQACRARWKSDRLYRDILLTTEFQDIVLVLDDDIGAPSHWGGKILTDGRIEGENQFGKILMNLRAEKADELSLNSERTTNTPALDRILQPTRLVTFSLIVYLIYLFFTILPTIAPNIVSVLKFGIGSNHRPTDTTFFIDEIMWAVLSHDKEGRETSDVSEGAFVRKVVDADQPVVFRQSPARQWGAMQWSPSLLRDIGLSESLILDPVLESSVSKSPGDLPFVLVSNRSSNDLMQWAVKRNDTYSVTKLRLNEFIDTCCNEDEQQIDGRGDSLNATVFCEGTSFRRLYYTGHISSLGPTLSANAGPMKPFEVNMTYLTRALNISPQPSYSIAWVSCDGVKAQTHFDKSANFFVNVMGRRTFTLSPPTDWEGMYLFPALHPSYHQSQVIRSEFRNIFDTAHKYPRAAAVQEHTVTLNPGDVLYVPPFWFHRVQSHGLAIGVSVISPSKEEMIQSQLPRLLPTRMISNTTTLSLEQKIQCLRALILLVSYNLDSIMDAKNRVSAPFILRVYLSRYEPKETILLSRSNIDTSSLCSMPIENVLAEVFENFENSDTEETYGIKTTAQNAFQTLKLLSPGKREIAAADYFEDITQGLIGRDNVGVFFKDCFF